MSVWESIQGMWKRNATLIMLLIANLLLRISWLAYTGYFAEDAFITLRYAQNLAEGRGFVYNPGQPVYGTTTPLFTFLMAFWIWLCKDPVPGAWLLNILASTGTVFFTHLALEKTRLSASQRLFALLLLICTPRLLFIDTQGMETPLVLLCIAASWSAFLHERWFITGILLGVTLLVRIDTITWVAMIALIAVYKDRRAGMLVTGLTTATYAPWLLFASIYFGSPIPQTITAKYWAYLGGGIASTVEILAPPIATVLDRLTPFWDVLEGSASYSFRPRMALIEDIGTFIFLSLSTLGTIQAFRKRNLSLIASFLLLEIFRLAIFRITFFNRYFITIIWAICLLSGYILGDLWDGMKAIRIPRFLRYVLPGVIFPLMMYQAMNGAVFYRDVQRYRHNASLRRIGEWLNENMEEGITVQLEPLGYIGYYSGLVMIDEVGLVTPEVINMKKQNLLHIMQMLEMLRPDVFVIHCDDAEGISEGQASFEVGNDEAYKFLIRFDPLNDGGIAQSPERNPGLARASCYEIWGKQEELSILPNGAGLSSLHQLGADWSEHDRRSMYSAGMKYRGNSLK